MSITCPKCHSDNSETLRFCGNCGTKLDASEFGRPQGHEDRASFTRTLETDAGELIRGMTFAGRYEIIEELGTGGMGRVYRAQDTKLNEEVALKLIKPEIAAERRVVERFRNEIRTTRKIAHKNVCRMYDFHEEGKTLYLTMEYVRGEDLKSLIHRTKTLSIGTALSIARQVAEGLGEAHKLGIVHRDLKPGNIMIDKDGQAKIMDFGIARVKQEKGITGEGAVIGTPEYMSPEQVEGKEADQRSDIYSLGIILFEMVTGRLPFEGETPFSIANKQKSELPPGPRKLNPQIPAELDRVILCCLEKDKAKRYQTAEEFVTDLSAVEQSIPATDRIALRARTKTSHEITVKFTPKKLLIPAVAAVALLALAGYFLFRGSLKPANFKLGRQQLVTHEPGLEIDPAFSPDGKMIAYTAGPLNNMALYVRALAGGHTIALTEKFPQTCRWPQWSPDGTKIAFQSGGSIYAVPYLGGAAQKIVEAMPGIGLLCAAWSPDGKQIGYIEGSGKIRVLSLDGGEPRTLFELKSGAERLHSLAWSPDGSKIAYVHGNWDYLFSNELGNGGPSSIWVAPVKGGDPVQITDDKSLNLSPAWLPGGRRLLYVSNKDGSRDIYHVSLDPSGKPLGPPVRQTTGLDVLSISLSSGGTRLAYTKFLYNSNIWSVKIPQGLPISLSQAEPVTTGNQAIEGLDISSDHKWLIYDTNLNGNQDIYRLPLAEGVPAGEAEQLTTDPNDDFLPAWSPDGEEIAFYSFKKGNRDLFLMKADGTKIRQLTEDPAQERYPDWSPDGLHLVFFSDKAGPDQDVYVMSRKTKDSTWGAPRLLVRGWAPKWSPDGRLIVYHSRIISKDVKGRNLKVISPEGGEPRLIFQQDQDPDLYRLQYTAWAPDSRTVYYKALDKEWIANIWSVPVAGGKPKLLVRLAKADDPFLQSLRDEWATDGRRFYFTLTKYEADIWQMDLSPGK